MNGRFMRWLNKHFRHVPIECSLNLGAIVIRYWDMGEPYDIELKLESKDNWANQITYLSNKELTDAWNQVRIQSCCTKTQNALLLRFRYVLTLRRQLTLDDAIIVKVA